MFNFPRYGVDLIHFTQNKGHAVHASTKENDIIRYMSLTENKYIRYFGGHDKRVVTMAMNPADETFLSGRLFFHCHCHVKSVTKWKEEQNYLQLFIAALISLSDCGTCGATTARSRDFYLFNQR